MNNRIIKFRVWDKLKRTMIYPDKSYQGHYSLSLKGKFHNLSNGSEGDEYIVMQYTDLKDSHGVEIYEGDNITYQPDMKPIYRNGIVEFSDYYHGWAIKDEKRYPETEHGIISMATPYMSFSYTKVVGHIYENLPLEPECPHTNTHLVQDASGNDSWIECYKCKKCF